LLAGLLNAASLAGFLAVPAGHPWIDGACVVGFGMSIGALICYLGGLLAIDCVPKEAAGAALGMVGIASYVGAGLQDAASGYLIQGFKQGSGPAAQYEFVPVGFFWVGAAVASALVTALIWRLSQRSAS
jgi:OPA family sugar phosphate sensor protein UhpC-like MFS transporter